MSPVLRPGPAERDAAMVDEALRRIAGSVPGSSGMLGSIRLFLLAEMAREPLTLVKLMKRGRRRALDRIGTRERRRIARDRDAGLS